jgi:hypothetical protein
MSTGESVNIAKTAPAALALLWHQGVFKDELDVEAIRRELASRHYHFPDGALLMALNRCKFLTRYGPKGAYKYIQKYPHEGENK